MLLRTLLLIYAIYWIYLFGKVFNKMSSTSEEEKDPQKAVPLDLARNQIANVRTVDAKTPLVMTSQSLRNMRVLAQGVSSSNTGSVGGPTIITTNLVSQAVLKSG